MAAQIRTALVRIGFSQQAATNITTEQGLDSLDEIGLLKDEEVENLCRVLRKPGGLAPGRANQPPVANYGTSVSLRAENNLKLMCYFIRFRKRTSRTVVPGDIDLVPIRSLRDYRTWEEEHTEMEAPEINTKDWPRTIDNIEEYLRGCLGTTKIPLAYVIRNDLDVKPEATDPSTNYASRQAELIARAPILINNNDIDGPKNQTFKSDNDAVWDHLAELTRSLDCWTYVKPAQRTRDGRKAFFNLKNHYLGKNNVDNLSTQAEQRLQALSYSGETRRWNMEKYVRAHMDQHNILQGLVEYGYSGIDERSKVRHLLNGIKTSTLDSVKAQVMSSAELRVSFEDTVNLFNDFIAQNRALQDKGGRERTVASMRTQQGGMNDEEIEADMSVEDRYYKKTEYDKLSPAKKKGLRLKRDKRNSKKKGKSGDGGGNAINLSKRTIKALATAMKSGDDTTDQPETDDEDGEPASKQPRNRNNPALNRK